MNKLLRNEERSNDPQVSLLSVNIEDYIHGSTPNLVPVY